MTARSSLSSSIRPSSARSGLPLMTDFNPVTTSQSFMPERYRTYRRWTRKSCASGMNKNLPLEAVGSGRESRSRQGTREKHVVAMGFSIGNQEWRKRSANKGGRPTREEMEKKKARDKAVNRKIERWAEAKADWSLARLFRIKRGRCPFCEKIS